MRNCVRCHEEIHAALHWKNVFVPEQKQCLCDSCENNLKKTSHEICVTCSKTSLTKQCFDCERWQKKYKNQDPLVKNISVFEYNHFVKEMVTKWKYRGDYEMGFAFQSVFKQTFQTNFKKMSSSLDIVPIPLSAERIQHRAFNQAEMLAGFLTRDIKQYFIRTQGEKQSKRNRKERLASANPFILRQTVNNPVVLVDDIYTTGRTLRHAAELLRKAGCPYVYAYTLIRG